MQPQDLLTELKLLRYMPVYFFIFSLNAESLLSFSFFLITNLVTWDMKLLWFYLFLAQKYSILRQNLHFLNSKIKIAFLKIKLLT